MNRIKSIRISCKNIKDDEDISIESSDDDDIIEETDDDMCILKTNDNKTMQFNVQLLDNQEYKISFKVEETK